MHPVDLGNEIGSFGRVPSSIDEQGVEEDVLVLKTPVGEVLQTKEENDLFKRCARKRRYPLKTRMLGPCFPK